MESISNVVKVSLANYLAELPLPNSVLGWFTIGFHGWLKLIPFFSAVGGVSYVTYRFIVPKSPCNPKTKKDIPKVVDSFDVEDLGTVQHFADVGDLVNFRIVMVLITPTTLLRAIMLVLCSLKKKVI